ncbi:VIT family domain-containing protein [Rutstroemia sp. NJR-2017a WRK4]|nr:VIT family domain-containing protein [Rutstroemia sp. NJR-2017a WRK4]
MVYLLIGGAILIVPMLIMAIHPTQIKSLITASLSTLTFATAISFLLKISYNETLVSTCTYAAVLVVFVGITTQVPDAAKGS